MEDEFNAEVAFFMARLTSTFVEVLLSPFCQRFSIYCQVLANNCQLLSTFFGGFMSEQVHPMKYNATGGVVLWLPQVHQRRCASFQIPIKELRARNAAYDDIVILSRCNIVVSLTLFTILPRRDRRNRRLINHAAQEFSVKAIPVLRHLKKCATLREQRTFSRRGRGASRTTHRRFKNL